MTCKPCQTSREGPTHAFHSLGCVFCGARSIQRIQRFQLPREMIAARCRAVLDRWVARGHAEAELRRLAKAVDLCTEPMDSHSPKAGKGKT